MSRGPKIAIGVLVVVIVVMGAILLGKTGQKKQRALRVDAIERSLPRQMASNAAVRDAGMKIHHATCVRQSDVRVRCIVDYSYADGEASAAVNVQLDNDRGAYLWEIAQ